MQHLTNTLWAMAVVRFEAPPQLLDRFAEALIERMADAVQPQHLSNASWAMARLRHNPLGGELMDKVIQRVGNLSCPILMVLILSAEVVESASGV